MLGWGLFKVFRASDLSISIRFSFFRNHPSSFKVCSSVSIAIPLFLDKNLTSSETSRPSPLNFSPHLIPPSSCILPLIRIAGSFFFSIPKRLTPPTLPGFIFAVLALSILSYFVFCLASSAPKSLFGFPINSNP